MLYAHALFILHMFPSGSILMLHNLVNIFLQSSQNMIDWIVFTVVLCIKFVTNAFKRHAFSTMYEHMCSFTIIDIRISMELPKKRIKKYVCRSVLLYHLLHGKSV